MACRGDLGRAQALVAAVCVAAVVASGAASADSALGIEVVAVGLRQPVQVVAAPGEPGRLYVVERAGRVRVVEHNRVLPGSFVDIRARVRSEGLLGFYSIAFHPRYRTNRRLYALYTGGSGRVFVAELRARGGRARPYRTLLSARISSSAYAHAGGQLAFGPGGQLLVGIGDGLDKEAAQDPESVLGKVVRLDVDDLSPEPKLVAMGLRNPWRFSFDRLTGDLFIGDVGEEDWEEIDVIRRGYRGVPNFGWGAATPDQAEPPFFRYAHPASRLRGGDGRLRLSRRGDPGGTRPVLLRRHVQRAGLEHTSVVARADSRDRSPSPSRSSPPSARTRRASSTSSHAVTEGC